MTDNLISNADLIRFRLGSQPTAEHMDQFHYWPRLVETALYWKAKFDEAAHVAALRAGGDPAIRTILLREFGTTDPELLAGEINRLYNRAETAENKLAELVLTPASPVD